MFRNFAAHFFTSSRLATLFATAARRTPYQVQDWNNAWTDNDLTKVFRSSVASLAAATYAARILNLKGESPPFDRETVRDAITRHRGILEAHNPTEGLNLVGSSLTLCAFDPDWSEPLSLAGLVHNKERFVSEFAAIKRRCFERDRLIHDDLFRKDPDLDLAEYVFELYENGFEHGRWNEERTEILRGLRFISVRKHICERERQLRSYADGFPELDHYVTEMVRHRNTLKYYEVTVVDQGLGVLQRFVADRPEYVANAVTREERLGLLRRILTETLTSKKSVPGAGGGIRKALHAARELEGFVSLRTDRFWLYASFPCGDGSIDFKEVGGAENLAPIAGAEFNAIFPLSR